MQEETTSSCGRDTAPGGRQRPQHAGCLREKGHQPRPAHGHAIPTSGGQRPRGCRRLRQQHTRNRALLQAGDLCRRDGINYFLQEIILRIIIIILNVSFWLKQEYILFKIWLGEKRKWNIGYMRRYSNFSIFPLIFTIYYKNLVIPSINMFP